MNVEVFLTSVVVSAIISGVMSWWVAKKEITSKQTTTYKELITAERIRWLNDIREEMCGLLSTARELAFNYIEATILQEKINRIGECNFAKEIEENNDKYRILIGQLKRNATKIILCVNPNEDSEFIDQVRLFSEKICNMTRDTNQTKGGFEPIIEDMEKACQKVLKDGWRQTKDEAKAMIENNAS